MAAEYYNPPSKLSATGSKGTVTMMIDGKPVQVPTSTAKRFRAELDEAIADSSAPHWSEFDSVLRGSLEVVEGDR